MLATNPTTYECLRCSGVGRIGQWRHIENGRCFACNGSGKVDERKIRWQLSQSVRGHNP